MSIKSDELLKAVSELPQYEFEDFKEDFIKKNKLIAQTEFYKIVGEMETLIDQLNDNNNKLIDLTDK